MEELITREELARRWRLSVKSVDRRRKDGALPWVDVALGRGARPAVRFRVEDIERLETEARMAPGEQLQQ